MFRIHVYDTVSVVTFDVEEEDRFHTKWTKVAYRRPLVSQKVVVSPEKQ